MLQPPCSGRARDPDGHRARLDVDLEARDLAAPAACAARHAKSRMRMAPIPTTTPPATSRGWCIPRYMREKATNVVSRMASVHSRALAVLLVSREVISSTSPE